MRDAVCDVCVIRTALYYMQTGKRDREVVMQVVCEHTSNARVHKIKYIAAVMCRKGAGLDLAISAY